MLGKISGLVLGFGLGLFFGNAGISLILATAGALIGHLLVDRDAIVPPKSEMPKTKEEILGPRAPKPTDPLVRALCPIFIEVARADGEVKQAEIRVAKEYFQSRGHDLEGVRLALKEAIVAAPADLEALVKQVRGQVAPPERLEVVNALYDLALADGDLSRAEGDALKRVVGFFNLGDEQLRAITARQLGNGAEHYQTLGLSSDVSDEDLKATFRRLAAEAHPDRVASQGPRAAEAAASKFRALKDAYEALKKLRGI